MKKRQLNKSKPKASTNSAFDGANFSMSRGYVYFPSLDTRKEVDCYSRRELTKKVRYLYNNSGFVRRCVNGIARYTCGQGISPQAQTKDEAWNKEAEQLFENRCGTKEVFDASGKYDFYRAQRQIIRLLIKDGEAFVPLLTSESGGARIRILETQNVGNAQTKLDQSLWTDGVRLDDNGRAIAYRVLGDNNNFTDLRAEDMIHFYDPERVGQCRGVTMLYHAVNNLLDTSEILAYEKQGVKFGSSLGFAIVSPDEPAASGLAAGLKVIKGPTGENISLKQVLKGEQIPWLKPGEEIKAINNSGRPSPTFEGFLDYLARDVSWGVGLSPEILWSIAGIGGANTRLILQDAQTFFEELQQLLIDYFCKRVWVWFIAKEMKSGRLRKPKDTEWWKHRWITPAKITVDRARDGKLQIELLKNAMQTWSDFYGAEGADWEIKINQRIKEFKFLKRRCEEEGINVSDILPPSPGAANSATTQEDEEE